jgi:RNA polymerase sigma factor (sigma-70 family)
MIATVRDDPSVIELVELARAGDQGAWDRIVERYAPLVWAVCRGFGLSRADAEDVSACVWLRLVERLQTIREPAALPGWLKTTTLNESRYLLRMKRRQLPVGDDAEDWFEAEVEADSDEWLLAQERQVALRAAFAGLAQRCRRLLSMLFADPPTPYLRISEELEMPIGSIGPSRKRCLAELRDRPELAALLESPSARTER